MHFFDLDGIALFAALTTEQKEDLARRIEQRELAAGHHLFFIGEPGSEFFVIRRGRLAITYPDGDGREVTLAVLAPGDFLGEISLLDGGPRTATARAQHEAVSLLVLDRESFFQFLRENPSAAIHILTILGKRQRESVDKLRGIRNVNEVMEEHLTTWQQAANAIAATTAAPKFLLAHAVAVAGWITLNVILGKRGPDPFPFPFLCFWTSCEAIFLSLFILVSQDAQIRKDRLRTEMEYQVALKAQFEIMQLHRKMDALPEIVLQQLRAGASEEAPTPGQSNEPSRIDSAIDSPVATLNHE